MAVVDTAEVDIVPTINVGSFQREAQAQIGRALSGLESEFRNTFNDIERVVGDAGDDLGDEIRRGSNRAEDSIDDLADQSTRDLGRIEEGIDELRQSMGGRLRRAVGGVAAAFGALQLGQGLKSAITSAADLGESINAVNVVLGEGADSFLEFGETAANELGLTQAALNEAVIPTAALLKEAGSEGDALSGQLQDLATRATDVGSVFNTDVNQVLDAFGATLRGETEPIRAFGVNINQAAIDAKALELGLADAEDEIDQAAKTQATFALIMEQTSDAAGDFEDTADSLPNLMRRLRATGEEAAAGLGEALLPALSEIGQSLLPAFDALEPVIGSLGEVLAEVVTAAAPLLEVLGIAFQSALQRLIPVIQPVADALFAVIDALSPILPLIANLIATLLPPLAQLIEQLATSMQPLILLFVQFVNEALGALQPLLPPIVDILTEVVSVLAESLFSALSAILPLWVELADALIPIIPELLGIVEAITPLLPLIFELIEALLPILIELLIELAPPLVELITLFTDLVELIVGTLADALAAVINFVTSSIGNFDELKASVRDVVNSIGDRIRAVRDFFGDLRRGIRDRVNDIRRSVVRAFNRVVNFVGRLPGRISNRLSGMWDGIKESFEDSINAVIGAWNDLSFTIPSATFFGQTIGGGTISTPNIGFINLQRGGLTTGEGLANLHANEVVMGVDSPQTISALTEALIGALSALGLGQQQAADGGRDVNLVLQSDGTDLAELLLQVLAKAIRIRGGNVQAVLGTPQRGGGTF